MRRVLAVAALLLFPWSAPAFLLSAEKIACAQVGSTQTFDTDPIAATTWTAQSVDTDCPVRWDTNAMERQRTGVGTSCDDTNAVTRFATSNTADQGCQDYQLVAYNNGTVGTDAWRPGLLFNTQSGAGAATQLQNWVYCNNLTCGTLTYVRTDGLGPLTCSTFGAVAVGDWMRVCWGSGEHPNKTVNVYNLGATTPAAPIRPGKPGDPVGAPECQFTTCPNGVCDSLGRLGGIYFGSNTVGLDGFVQGDNFKMHACAENPS